MKTLVVTPDVYRFGRRVLLRDGGPPTWVALVETELSGGFGPAPHGTERGVLRRHVGRVYGAAVHPDSEVRGCVVNGRPCVEGAPIVCRADDQGHVELDAYDATDGVLVLALAESEAELAALPTFIADRTVVRLEERFDTPTFGNPNDRVRLIAAPRRWPRDFVAYDEAMRGRVYCQAALPSPGTLVGTPFVRLERGFVPVARHWAARAPALHVALPPVNLGADVGIGSSESIWMLHIPSPKPTHGAVVGVVLRGAAAALPEPGDSLPGPMHGVVEVVW